MASAIDFMACKDLCCWQNDTCLSLGELYLLYQDDFHQFQHFLLTGRRSIHKHLHPNRLWSLNTTVFHIVNLSYTYTFHLCHFSLPIPWSCGTKTFDEAKILTIMQFDFTTGTASLNWHRSLASKVKACNAQGRTIIGLYLSLSKWWNLIMVLGLSVQQHLLWAQSTQLEFTTFDTSINKFSTVCCSDENQEFQGCHFLNIQIEESTNKWSLMKHWSSQLKAKS